MKRIFLFTVMSILTFSFITEAQDFSITIDAENPSGVDNINGSNNLRDVANVPYGPAEDDYARRLTDDGYVLEFRTPRACINTPDGR